MLLIPLVTGPFGYLYLAHDLMIFGIAAYIQRDLSQDVSQVLGRDISLADARFEHLSDAGLLAHRVLAPSRWLLFLFPTVIPVVYAAFFTEVWKDFPFSVLFALDCIIIAVLLLTMAAAAREQAVWRRRHGGPRRSQHTDPAAALRRELGLRSVTVGPFAARPGVGLPHPASARRRRPARSSTPGSGPRPARWRSTAFARSPRRRPPSPAPGR